MEISAKVRKLHKAAVQARQNAYAPYSKFKVGAGLLSSRGRVFQGCNVENASYGGTVCAERVAILRAVADGVSKFTDIVVVTDTANPASPCALCLQIMAEFFEPETRIWVANSKTIKSVYNFGDILPLPFGPKQLKDAR